MLGFKWQCIRETWPGIMIMSKDLCACLKGHLCDVREGGRRPVEERRERRIRENNTDYRHCIWSEASDAERMSDAGIGSMIAVNIGHESEMASGHDCIEDDGYDVIWLFSASIVINIWWQTTCRWLCPHNSLFRLWRCCYQWYRHVLPLTADWKTPSAIASIWKY